MAKRSGIELIEETGGRQEKRDKSNDCPVCGAPGGLEKCEKCGWGVEEYIDPAFSDKLADPVSTLRDARMGYRSMKEDISKLKETNKLLIENNHKFAELVETMAGTVSKLRTEAGKKYVYSFGEGGWGEAGKDGKSAIRLGKQVSVDDINRQLMEITHLINKYKK